MNKALICLAAALAIATPTGRAVVAAAATELIFEPMLESIDK